MTDELLIALFVVVCVSFGTVIGSVIARLFSKGNDDLPPVCQFPATRFVKARFRHVGQHQPLPFPDYYATPGQRKEIMNLVLETRLDPDSVMRMIKEISIEDIERLTNAEAEEIITLLKAFDRMLRVNRG